MPDRRRAENGIFGDGKPLTSLTSLTKRVIKYRFSPFPVSEISEISGSSGGKIHFTPRIAKASKR